MPVLWDKETNTIVNNELSEIIRMFNSAFDGVGAAQGDYYPEDLRPEIDALNARIYATVNNGVYRAGFATSQGAYEEAFRALFETLDWLEARLARPAVPVRRAADRGRLAAVHHPHPLRPGLFRPLQVQPEADPGLPGAQPLSASDLYRWPGVAETVDFDHIKRHYYMSHRGINPTGIVPLGPEIKL